MHIHSDALKKEEKKPFNFPTFLWALPTIQTITLLLKIFVLEINRLF